MSHGHPNRPTEDPRPVPPAAPDPAECCGEGCAHCVLDIYDAAMERYEAELAAWHARHEIPTEKPDAKP